ncbi:MAG: hypothetical protein U9R38_01210 [Candidatus Margulisiibacteriota bacterium]|nr:hypothetical protein [Candidatus Margulisiibacteriota bacterium]
MKARKNIAIPFYKAAKSFAEVLPMLLGVLLLMGLFQTFISKEIILSIFTGNIWRDTLIGALAGSISAGNPIVSYMIGGELLKQQVSLLAVTAFMVAWVTVGVIQLPAEIHILGERFAIARNIISFILSILVSIATVLTLTLIQ